MKAVCLMLHFLLSGTEPVQQYEEKIFGSLLECRMWVHQQEFLGPQPPAILTFRTCILYME